MGKSQRDKGARGERYFRDRFLEAGWIGTKRGLGQTRAGNEVPDIDVPTLWVECKAWKKTNPRAALAQAIKASEGSGRTPIAVTKDDRQPPIVTLRYADWLALAKPDYRQFLMFVQRGARTNPRRVLAQAVAAAHAGTSSTPIAKTQDGDQEWLITILLSDFLKLVPPIVRESSE